MNLILIMLIPALVLIIAGERLTEEARFVLILLSLPIILICLFYALIIGLAIVGAYYVYEQIRFRFFPSKDRDIFL